MRRLHIAVCLLVLCSVSLLAAAKVSVVPFTGGFFEEHRPARGEELVNFIKETIEPESWQGDRTISYRGGYLAVVHTERVHRKIERLLDALRASGMPLR